MQRSNAEPLIGMPARMDPGLNKQYLSRHYSDSVAVAGGIPIILPLLDEPGSIRRYAEGLDGILLTGSNSDVDPAAYGASRASECGPTQPLRDGMDFLLLAAAQSRKIPVLAICFGMQSLNVFMGGTLIQDIPSGHPSSIQHDAAESAPDASHTIQIATGSILNELAGDTSNDVNSTHHQAVDRVASALDVIARAPDGIIEALTGKDPNHWILGVQWHPEKTFAYDKFSRRIFEFFLARCRARRVAHERPDT